MTLAIGPGSRVTLHYTLQLRDGTVVDSTRSGEPAIFVIGDGELADLLENRLLGMVAGEHRHIELSAMETRTLATAQTAERLPRTDFPAGIELQAAQVVGFTLPDGQEIPGLVLELTDTEVVVDFSHPLAGRDLVFDVEILAVEPTENSEA
jgi:FKBP-type peptidyl-prolyl cis-trans isomerase SlpA